MTTSISRYGLLLHTLLRYAFSISVFLLLVAVFGAGPASASQSSTTLYVTYSGNDTGNCQNSSSPCRTLQYTLNQATGSNVTIIASGVVFASSTAGVGATIPDKVTSLSIIGTNSASIQNIIHIPPINPPPITGGSVITVPSSNQNVTLSNLTISAGYNKYGGGIYNQGGTVTLNGVSVVLNQATYGGGIYNDGTMTLTNSTVSNNRAGNVTVQCTSTSNCFQKASGGGIYNNGPMSITRTLVSGNEIISFLSPSSSSPLLYFGGGIYNESVLSIFASSVNSNAILPPENIFPAPPGSTTEGGGIFNFLSQQVTVVASTIANNAISVPSDGAGIYLGPGLFAGLSVVQIGASYIVNNTDIGGPTATDNCVAPPLNGIIQSLGYNVSNSSQCSLAASTDQNNANVVMTKDGGYYLPNSGSIGVGMVPFNTAPMAGFSVCPAVDELGNARPSSGSSSCDVGAIEIGSTTPASPPSITTPNSTTFTDGHYGSFSFGASGAPSSVFSISGSLPPGVSLSPLGKLSGTASSSSPYSFSVTANNQDGTSTQDFTLEFQRASSLVSLSASPSSEVGMPVKVSVAVEDSTASNIYAPTGTVSITTSGSSQPLCIAPLTALSVQNQPIDIAVGSCTIGSLPLGTTHLVANYAGDAVYSSSTSTVPISVSNALSIQSTPYSPATTGSTYSYSPTIAGGVGPYTFTYSGTVPPGLSFNATNGSLTGTPTSAGTYAFSLDVKDSLGAVAHQSGTMTVVKSPATLALSLSPTTVLANSPVTFSAIIHGYNPTGQVSFYSGNTSLCTAVINTNVAACTVTPTTGTYNIYAGYIGDPNNDAANSISNSLSVIPVLDISGSNLNTATVNSFYSTSLTALGGVTPYTWSVVSGQLPSGLVLSPSGVLSGTPTSQGASTFTVLVSDSGTNLHQQKEATFTLTVQQAAQIAPAAVLPSTVSPPSGTSISTTTPISSSSNASGIQSASSSAPSSSRPSSSAFAGSTTTKTTPAAGSSNASYNAGAGSNTTSSAASKDSGGVSRRSGAIGTVSNFSSVPTLLLMLGLLILLGASWTLYRRLNKNTN